MASDSKDFKIKIATEASTAELAAYNAELDKTQEKVDAISNDDADIADFTKGSSAKIETVSDNVDTLGDRIDDTKGKAADLGEEITEGIGNKGAGALQGIMGKLGLFGAALATLGPLAYEAGQKIGQWLNGGKDIEKLNEEAEKVAENFGKINQNVTDTRARMDELTASTQKAGDAFTALSDRSASMAAGEAERKRQDKIAESEAAKAKAEIKNDSGLTDVEKAEQTAAVERAELERKAAREIAELEKTKADAIEKRNKAAQDQAGIAAEMKRIRDEVGQNVASDGSPEEVAKQNADLERQFKELNQKFNELEKARDAAGRDYTKAENDIPAVKAINENKLAEFDANAAGSISSAQKRAADQKAADAAKAARDTTREDNATQKGLTGQDKATEKELINNLNDLGKATNKSTAEGKKAAEEIKAAAQSLADGGTAEELSQVSALLSRFGSATDSNVQRLLAVAESNLARAEALESRIKALETKAARNSALSSN